MMKVFVLLMAVAVVLAQPGTTGREGRLAIGERSFTVTENSATDLLFVSKQRTAKDEGDVIRFRVAIGPGGRLNVRNIYLTKAGGSVNIESQFQVRFARVVEFVDTGAPGWDGETAVQSVVLNDVITSGFWEDFVYVAAASDDDKATVTVTSSTTAPKFTLLLSFSGAPFTSSTGAELSPNDMKIDVSVDGWDYQGRNDTVLGIVTLFDSDKTPEKRVADSRFGGRVDTEITFSGDSSFTWDSVAMCDGAEVPVLVSTLAVPAPEDTTGGDERSAGESTMATVYTFQSSGTCASIAWDPTLSSPVAGDVSAASAFVPSVLCILLAVLACVA